METSRKRIIDFIEKQHIKPKDFLTKTGLSKGFLDRTHQKSSASDKYLSKILESYPNINTEWLLTGKEPMLKNNTNLTHGETTYCQINNKIIQLLEAQITLLEENKSLQAEKIARLEQELKGCKKKQQETNK